MRPALSRELVNAHADIFERVRETTTAASEPYARDPLLHLRDGHVQILDLERMVPVRFDPYDHEVELIVTWIDVEHLRETGELRFRNTHGEKSRQMGWTWTCAYVILWALNHHPVRGLAMHLKLAKIDDGGFASTVESLFGKIRFMAQHGSWPESMNPADVLIWRQGVEHQIVNRMSGAFVLGEGATPDPGRGGTYHFALLDEAARIPWQRSVQASIINACRNGRLYASTPQGQDNVYAEMRNKRPRGFSFLRHHWSIHPIYGRGVHIAGETPETCGLCAGNRLGLTWDASDPRCHRYPGRLTSPWYDAVVVEMTDEQVAQELDIDYTLSLPARVYGEFSEDLHVVPHIDFENTLGLELSWDFGWTHATAVGIWQDSPFELRKIGEYEVTDHTPEEVAAGLRATFDELGLPMRYSEPSQTRMLLSIGDPHAEGTEISTGRSLATDYRKQGFTIVSKQASVGETIIAYKRLLMGRPKPVRYSRDTCPKTIRHLLANRWPTDRQGNRKLGAPRPLDDEHNHMCRADAYFINWKYPPPQVEETLGNVGFGWEGMNSPYLDLDQVPVDERSGLIDPGLSTDMNL